MESRSIKSVIDLGDNELALVNVDMLPYMTYEAVNGYSNEFVRRGMSTYASKVERLNSIIDSYNINKEEFKIIDKFLHGIKLSKKIQMTKTGSLKLKKLKEKQDTLASVIEKLNVEISTFELAVQRIYNISIVI